ncbi:CHRD domain-containing protein [Spirillospora sp. NPDC048911]|uniref:CHRD domain-containing protein n=1 Tax=Spirillospora sp. NPDC048911 TaxID=3364527 RepID=UPI0037174460
MGKRKIALTALALTAGTAAVVQAPAAAASTAAPAGLAAADAASRAPQFFAARMSGANEVPAPGGPAVGDQDGSATGIVRVQGDRVTFALSHRNIGAPTLAHIHQGRAGANGPVKVGLFASALPATVTAAAGSTTVEDRAVADAIRANPSGFYFNVHTAEFPGGAVRGQLTPLGGRLDVLQLLKGGGLRAFMSGDQEVPVEGGPKVGDPDGRAVTFIRARGTTVSYSAAWVGFTPTLGHIHKGRFGTNGPISVPLFGSAVPSTVFAVAGTVPGIDPAVIQEIRSNPRGFYANLHSAEFPGGAVRGQLNG